MKALFALAALLLAAPAWAQTTVYVSPQGNDKWSGRLAAPNKARADGPVATLERARDLVRKGSRDKSATVYLRGGDYLRDKPFVLSGGMEGDGGTKRTPVTYRAYRDETPRLIGGRPLTNWKPVSDEAVLARLEPEVRTRVRQTDLKALGVTDYGVLSRRGFGGDGFPPLELFANGKPMTLARYPNDDWAKIASVPEGADAKGQFVYEGDRPRRWKDTSDVWVYGYWKFDWADLLERVSSLNLDTRVVGTDAPHSPWGYGAGKRFYWVNVLEELDAPGEYFLDRKTGLLYFYPPDSDALRTAFVSVLAEPLISLRDASYVTLRGLTLEGSRGNGVEVKGGVHNLVAGCTVRNVGQSGVVVQNSLGSGVQSCDVSLTGDDGIVLEGGDRKTLASGRLFAVNNHIHHTSRLRQTYHPAVSVNGVGCRVAHNRIHDLPHTAIQGGGNEHRIEYNEIYRVCQETGDAGAFYMGRDFSQRGNVVRFNHFHDLRAGALKGQEESFTDVMAVYLDDCFSGVTVYGNLFVRAGRSAMIGGGRDNTIENNIFIDGSPAVHVDARGKSWAAKYFVPNGEWQIFEKLAAMNPTHPPYSERYPSLATLMGDDPAFPRGNRVLRNISVGGRWREMQDGLTDKDVQFEGNIVDMEPGFRDAAIGDYRLKSNSPALKAGFKPLPFALMGLQRDEYRKTLPPR